MKWITLIIMLAASTAGADGVAFKYTNSDGVVSFTDDPKRIPEKFQAEQIAFDEYDRLTPIQNSLPTVPKAIPTAVAEIDDDCGPISVRSERRDTEGGVGGEGSFNTRFYIAEDDCRVLFDAPYYPDLNSLRS